MLNIRELTGRATTHVAECSELGCILHPQAAAAALAMRDAARAEGIELQIVSAFRDFGRQEAIWNAKFRGERVLYDRAGNPIPHADLTEDALIDAILLWSALPGASRHHWGTDVDVVDRAGAPADYRFRLVPEEFAAGGPCARLDGWLADNMGRFGFFRPYRTDLGGVHPEPWHLSFAPVAGPALAALTPAVLAEAIQSSAMLGRERVLQRLPELHRRYVQAVDRPDGISAGASRLS